MEEFLAFVLIFASGIIALWVSLNVGFLSPASIFLWFMTIDIFILYVIFFTNLSRANFTFTAMPWPDFGPVIVQTSIIYATFIFIGWLSILGLKKTKRNPKSKNKSDFSLLENLEKRVGFNNRTTQLFLIFFLLSTIFIEIYHFIELDKSIFWSNTTYLMLVSPDLAGFTTPIGRFSHLFFPFMGLILIALASYFWVKRSLILSILIFILSFYPFLMVFAQNSRWAALYPAGIIAVAIVFGKQKIEKFVIFSTMGFASLIVFIKVLIGRGTPYQGLSGTFEIFRIAFLEREINKFIPSIPLNIFQGAQNLANTLQLQPEYPTIYKLLSFSPTISLIDNFSSIAIYTAKIAPVVPVNAYGEAYYFGIPFFAAFLVILFFWIRYTTRAHIKGGIIGAAISLAAYWTIFYISQYPIRNSMRFIYIILLIAIFFVNRKNKNRKISSA